MTTALRKPAYWLMPLALILMLVAGSCNQKPVNRPNQWNLKASSIAVIGTKYFTKCDQTGGHCARLKVELNTDAAPVPAQIRGNGYVTCFNGNGDYPCTAIGSPLGLFRYVDAVGPWDYPKSCNPCPLYLNGGSQWLDQYYGLSTYYHGGDFTVNTGTGVVRIQGRTDMIQLTYP